MEESNDYCRRVDTDGYCVARGVLGVGDTTRLRDAIASLPDGEAVRRRQGVYGVRHLLELCPEVRQLAARDEVRNCVEPILGATCFAVRATFLDKVAGANWDLRWHQDSVISVSDRVETRGYTAWATKAGVHQVRPPVGVLRGMLAARVHLDDCFADNGPLRVLVGSHKRRWEREQIEEAKSRYPARVVEARAGDVMLMRPLLLHASSAAERPTNRRVVHIEYACDDLPAPLEWRDRVAPVATTLD